MTPRTEASTPIWLTFLTRRVRKNCGFCPSRGMERFCHRWVQMRHRHQCPAAKLAADWREITRMRADKWQEVSPGGLSGKGFSDQRVCGERVGPGNDHVLELRRAQRQVRQ